MIYKKTDIFQLIIAGKDVEGCEFARVLETGTREECQKTFDQLVKVGGWERSPNNFYWAFSQEGPYKNLFIREK